MSDTITERQLLFGQFLWDHIGRRIEGVTLLDGQPVVFAGAVTCAADGGCEIGSHVFTSDETARWNPLRWRRSDPNRERTRVLPEDVPGDLVVAVLHDYRAASEEQVRGILAALFSIVPMDPIVRADADGFADGMLKEPF